MNYLIIGEELIGILHLLKIESRKRMDRLLRGASLTFGLPGTLELPWCSRDVFRVPVSPIMPDPVG